MIDPGPPPNRLPIAGPSAMPNAPVRSTNMAISMTPIDKRAALEQLHAEHYRSLVRSAAWIVNDLGLAEELVQEGFIKLAQSWDDINDKDAARAYLQRIIINLSRSRVRRIIVGRGKYKKVGRAHGLGDDASSDWSAGLLDGDLGQAIRRLPRRQRECVVLRFEQDLTVEQIAAALGIAEGSVKSHIHRGVTQLRSHLTEENAQ